MGKIALSLAIGVGGTLLAAALAPKPKDQYGPRISDINVPAVSPGNPIIRHWGTMKLPGQLIWTSRLIETENVERVGGGKKGGGGSKKQKVYTYTYSVDCAIAVCQGPVYRINRIWANQKLLWQHQDIMPNASADFDNAFYEELYRLVNTEGLTDVNEAYAGAFFFAFNNFRPDEYTYKTEQEAVDYIMAHPGTSLDPPIAAPDEDAVAALIDQMLDGLGRDQIYAKNKIRFDGLSVYLGSDEQLPNALIEEYLGVGNVPAYRGVCYFVMRNLQLEDFGNGIPSFTVEVQKANGDTYLHEIINGVCAGTGLDPADYDGIGYIPASIKVDGFAVTQSASARQIINSLQSVYPFDASETGGRITFQWINSRPVAVIRRADFGAHMEGDEMPPSVEVTRTMDEDLPRRLQLRFQEPARSYSPNMVFAQRSQTASESVEDIDVTIALSRQEAKTRIEDMLMAKFTARKSHRVFLPRKYVVIEPGDAVLVDDPSGDPANYLSWRCVTADISPYGLIDFTFVDHNQHPVASATTEADPDIADNEADTIPLNSPTVAYLLDTPLLNDTDEDTVGFYTVLTGNRNSWPGGALLLDVTSGGAVPAFEVSETAEASGSSWYVVADNDVPVAHGFAMTKLAVVEPGTWDYVSRVRIYMLNREIDLVSVDPNDLLSQYANVAVIGNEVIQYANVTEIGNGVWELSTLLRGLRGTEHEISNHVVGDRFVRLQNSSTERVTHDVTNLNTEATFRVLTYSDDPDSATPMTFTNTGNSLRPYSPALVQALRRDNDDIDLAWSPRVRQNGGLISGVTLAVDQAVESYEIDVLDGDTVVRTIETTDRDTQYTAANQTADFGGTDQLVSFRVYQIGAIVGRGFALEVSA